MNIATLSTRFDNIIDRVSTETKMSSDQKIKFASSISNRISNKMTQLTKIKLSNKSDQDDSLNNDLGQVAGNEMIIILEELKEMLVSSNSDNIKETISQIDKLMEDIK